MVCRVPSSTVVSRGEVLGMHWLNFSVFSIGYSVVFINRALPSVCGAPLANNTIRCNLFLTLEASFDSKRYVVWALSTSLFGDSI